MSHTVKIKVKIKDRALFAKIIEEQKGKVLGEGKHNLFSSSHQGFGFQLNGWQYPCIVTEDNDVFYDNFNGSWGKPEILTNLMDAYTIGVAKQAADQAGWTNQMIDGKLLIYHPDGGTLTVEPSGKVDVGGFVGKNCDVASIIEEAMGTTVERCDKAEYLQTDVHQRN